MEMIGADSTSVIVDVSDLLHSLAVEGKLFETNKTEIADGICTVQPDMFEVRHRVAALGHDVLDGFAEKLLDLLRPRGRWCAFTATQVSAVWRSEEVGSEEMLDLFERLGLIVPRGNAYRCTVGFVEQLNTLRDR